jgi:hypothetical protein
LLLYAGGEVFPSRAKLVQFTRILPAIRTNPLVGTGLNFVQGGVTLEEEVEFRLVKSAISILNHSGHLEGEHKLMLLEDTHASEFVHKLGDLVDDEAETRLEHIILLGGLERIHEDSHV